MKIVIRNIEDTGRSGSKHGAVHHYTVTTGTPDNPNVSEWCSEGTDLHKYAVRVLVDYDSVYDSIHQTDNGYSIVQLWNKERGWMEVALYHMSTPEINSDEAAIRHAWEQVLFDGEHFE